MAITRAQIRSIIQNAFGFGADTQSVAAQNYAISLGLADIATERKFHWLQTAATGSLTAGSESITEPADFAIPLSFKIKSPGANPAAAYWPLQQVTADELDASLWTTSAPTPAERGVPDRWAHIRDNVRVYPRPDLAYAYELVYVAEPTLDWDGTFSDSETVPIPEDQFQHLVALAAVRYLSLRKRDYALYDRFSAEYQRLKTQLENWDKKGEPTHVVEWDGWRALSGGHGSWW